MLWFVVPRIASKAARPDGLGTNRYRLNGLIMPLVVSLTYPMPLLGATLLDVVLTSRVPLWQSC